MKNNNQPSGTNTPITDYFLQDGSDSYTISSNASSASENTNKSRSRFEAYAEYIAAAGKTASKP